MRADTENIQIQGTVNMKNPKLVQFARITTACTFLLGISATVNAGFIVVTNNAGKGTATSNATTGAAAQTLDTKNIVVNFKDRVVGAANPTTGNANDGTLTYNGNTGTDTRVFVANTFAAPNGNTSSSNVSFNVNSGTIAGSLPSNLSNLARGTASSALSISLAAQTAGAHQAVIGVHRGTPFNASNATFGSPSNTDLNNTISLNANVFDHSMGSFSSSSQVTTLALNFGNVTVGTTNYLNYDIYNNIATLNYTAGLDLTAINGTVGPFDSGASTFSNLSAGSSFLEAASFSPTSLGAFTETFTFTMNDDANLFGVGAGTQYTMTLILSGNGVAAVPEPSALALAAMGAFGIVAASRVRRRQSA